jgi:cell filamentation protein
MSWDRNPWEPAEDGVILRNKFGATTKEELDSFEFTYSRTNMGRALEMLKLEQEITLDSWMKCHEILFSEIYPWAGQLRHVDAQRGLVAFNFVSEIEESTNEVLTRAVTPSFFRNNLGQVYSKLAFNHPFLDGNGRSLNAVFTELARRDDVGIAWDRVDKPTYLSALRSGITLGLYEPLHTHLYDRLVILDYYDPVESLTAPHKPK